ncbi:CocE/NonD family hydrolase [Blastococcus saxobsidens]|uniref:Putative CocE/NonD family hydrolase n=1 Tax=Blastococcus saxobsidens TaxID=138336 RepID=A0A4Q7Y1L2_9ACTN|nr:CocE/NonD family hydrolase [Blastococcus saxobsidens]RZU30670.1 putative CocE/NonD family hydrolase [Blastococcus saxobsidens]
MTSTPRPARRIARCLGLALPLVVAVSLTQPATAAPPDDHPGKGRPSTTQPAAAFDYTQVAGLTADRFGTVQETLELPMHDGTEVHIEVTRPAGADGRPADGQWPVILEASPYHGTLADREGRRILPEPRDEEGISLGLTGYFAPKGYAVVMMDLRGTGLSDGCLDHLGANDAKDLEQVVEWAASQPWSNGRVGMTGHSYVGSTPSLAAAMDPEGLETIVPSAGMATMYDHQFQAGVPYFLQWAGPMAAYEQIALERDLPGGEHFGQKPEETGCGLPNSSLTAGEAQLSGQYTSWHGERDWRAAATAADLPVFMVHGVNDNAARVAGMDWFTQRGGRDGDKIWLGQWDHGSGCCPTRRGIQWTYALHAWFDKHLAQRDVETGPAAELFLSDGTFEGGRTGDRSQILSDSQWPPSGSSMLTLHPAADGTLGSTAPVVPGSVSFTGDPTGFADPQGTGGADFVSAPVAEDTVLAGKPLMDLVASVTAPRVHLIGTLYDESPDGERRRISQFAINPELRVGVATPKPVVPGQLMEMQPPGFAMAHNLREGHRLALRFTTSDPDKVPTFAVDPRVTIATGPGGTSLQVPVVAEPALVEDTVPFSEHQPAQAGPAQPAEQASVTPALGGPARTPATVAFHEFDAQEGFDNAALLISAVPSLDADVDLYLQRQNADGTWTADLASGGSSSLTEESLRYATPAPGRYRVEVHNWAGAPGTRVDLSLTWLNSAGRPG